MIDFQLDAVPLGQLLLRPPRYGINAAAVPLTQSTPVYIRITDIDRSGRFSPDLKVGVDHPQSVDYLLKPGELLFARTGASVGKSYLYDSHDGELVYAGFLINIAPDPKRLNPTYLAVFAQSKAYWDWVARTSARSGQPGVNARELSQLPIPLPDLATQDRIAEAVTNADALGVALEQSISKREYVLRGAMQELLTGSTRLPGFSGSWNTATLGEIAEIVSGGTPSRAIPGYWNGGIAWCTPTDITREKGRYLERTDQTISREGLATSAARLLPPGTLLLCTRATIGEVKIASAPIATNQGFKSLVPHGEISSEFLYYKLLTMREDLNSRGAGSTFLEVTKRDVADLALKLPSAEEQAAIAEVLTTADDQIDRLRRRLAKARAIKQAMVQELLSGRARLPSEGVAA